MNKTHLVNLETLYSDLARMEAEMKGEEFKDDGLPEKLKETCRGILDKRLTLGEALAQSPDCVKIGT